MAVTKHLKFRAWQDGKMRYQHGTGNYALAEFFGALYEDAPVMMFSKFIDANGQDVYNGDIVNLKAFVRNDLVREAEVKHDGEFYLEAKDNGEKYGLLYAEYVIGNIYETSV